MKHKEQIEVAALIICIVFLACADNSTGPKFIGNLDFSPEIHIEKPLSGARWIQGTANNINAKDIQVVIWAKTNKWYVQPFIHSPFTRIRSDGTWGSSTHTWFSLVALLVDSTYVPGSIREYHPSSDPGVVAWDEYPPSNPSTSDSQGE